MNRKDAKRAKHIAMSRCRIEKIGSIVVDSSIRVHRALGPGLLESAYQLCLAHELRRRGCRMLCEENLPLTYDGIELDVGYRIDMLVDEEVIVENKTVERILPIHEAQLLTYMKIGRYRLGFLLNWHVRLMKHGVKRMVLDL